MYSHDVQHNVFLDSFKCVAKSFLIIKIIIISITKKH